MSSAASKKNKSVIKNDILQQQDVMQAVLIAECYNNRFAPLLADKPSALFPVVNKCLIDYSLEALEKCGVQEAFVFCSTHSQQIRDHISENWSGVRSTAMTVTVISSESFMSLGDAIRELDSKALIRSDFILINGHVVTTFPLMEIMEQHRKRRKTDKGCAMTLIYSKVHPQHKVRCIEDDTLMAVETSTEKVIFYQKINDKKSINIPLEVFQANDDVSVHYNISDCHMCICSPSVPPLYADNFDYQTFDDLVKGLLINEEILGNSMYLHVAENGYAGSISNLYTYDTISEDIVQRWSYPIVPDLFMQNGSRYCHLRHNVYRNVNIDLHRNCILHHNVVLGKDTVIGENTCIENTVIGNNCCIGANVKIKGSYLWDNVVVGDNCELDTCLLADNVVLKTNVKVDRGCILSSKVVIGDYVTLPQFTKLQSEPPEDGFGDSYDGDAFSSITENLAVCDPKYVGVDGHGFLFVESDDTFSDDESSDVYDVWGSTPGKKGIVEDRDINFDGSSMNSNSSDACSNCSEDNRSQAAEEEDTLLFYNEVLDSLQRGIEEKIKSENLILEINSSKYAYNVTMKEVNSLVMKAILSIPQKTAISGQEYFTKLKPVLLDFIPLISNYIKSAASQVDCLQSIEEFLIDNEEFSSSFMKILHVLYEKEVLNEHVILKWYEKPQKGSEYLRKQLIPFVKWLKEADEESSED